MLIRASNVALTDGQFQARLTADAASGVSTLTVDNISGFSIGKYAILGDWNDPNGEIVRLHVSTAPTGSTITLNAATVYDHFVGTAITIIDFNQVEFSRSTTLVDANISPGTLSIINTASLQADRFDTAYDDLTNITGYAYFRFKNSALTTYSLYSTGVSYSGAAVNAVSSFVEEALGKVGMVLNERFAEETRLLTDANECQDYITQTTDWVFELISNDTSIATTEYTNTYSLSSLTYEMKYDGTYQGFKSLKLGADILNYIDISQMDEMYYGTPQSTLSAGTLIGATSITLVNSAEFGETGTVNIGSDIVTYTANAQTTGVLSGIPASGTGSLTATHTAGDQVWQGFTSGKPQAYSVFSGKIILNQPVSSTYAGQILKPKYIKKLTRFTSFASTTDIPFFYLFSDYIASNIEFRKGNNDEGNKWLTKFTDKLKRAQDRYMLPTLQEYQYYNFGSNQELRGVPTVTGLNSTS